MDEGIDPKKVQAKVGHHSHVKLKEVEFIGFTGSVREIELVLHLVEIAASLERLVIRVCALSSSWLEEDVLSYERNQYHHRCRSCAQLLKPLIRPEIDVVIIY